MPARIVRAVSSWQITEPCFWTKSQTSLQHNSPSSCAFWRPVNSSGVGSSKTRRADVRILTATNADLRKEIDAGRFREDLFFRLNTIQIHLPALRERVDDIPVLAGEFLTELMQRYRRQIQGFHPDAVAALKAYPWPGNVRELRHVIERAVLLTRSSMVQASDLGIHRAPAKAPQLEQMDLDAAEAIPDQPRADSP